MKEDQRKLQRKKELLARALLGDMEALTKVGIMLYLRGDKNKRFAKACIKRAMDMGSEYGYLAYHRLFSERKKVIDDKSYEEMAREYRKSAVSGGAKRKKILAQYLSLGTEEQKLKCLMRTETWTENSHAVLMQNPLTKKDIMV